MKLFLSQAQELWPQSIPEWWMLTVIFMYRVAIILQNCHRIFSKAFLYLSINVISTRVVCNTGYENVWCAVCFTFSVIVMWVWVLTVHYSVTHPRFCASFFLPWWLTIFHTCKSLSLHNVLDKPVCCFSDPYTDSSDVEDGGTQLEYAADQCTDQLLSEMSPDPLTIPDLQAYICWYCARPFIGRGSFYIHLLQEAMALPGKPLKCCLIISALPSFAALGRESQQTYMWETQFVSYRLA